MVGSARGHVAIYSTLRFAFDSVPARQWRFNSRHRAFVQLLNVRGAVQLPVYPFVPVYRLQSKVSFYLV
jgi:hypothetical protein